MSISKILNEIAQISFEYGEADIQKMYEICDHIKILDNPREILPHLFSWFEKFSTYDVGNPGPFVHLIEESNDYHELLMDSIARKPTIVTLWMVNRLVNRTENSRDKDTWLQVLKDCVDNPLTDGDVRQSAIDFLTYQNTK